MKTKSYNNINTITKNRKIKNIKKINITKKKKNRKSCLNFVASEAEKRKKIHKVC
jgi:hypothetical protein